MNYVIMVYRNGIWKKVAGAGELKSGEKVQLFDAEGNLIKQDGKEVLTVASSPFFDGTEWKVVLY